MLALADSSAERAADDAHRLALGQAADAADTSFRWLRDTSARLARRGNGEARPCALLAARMLSLVTSQGCGVRAPPQAMRRATLVFGDAERAGRWRSFLSSTSS
jgi:hypothetical protein